ncbi:octopamine receptor 1-like [Stylophora pistillata]|uniref:octopamine receptor 1-like n=1 Tax=Stylophora pistillata TaxID=50429 RepID=UPI000C057B9F|nr:octopamine receptor 1-like [Stylophora pistillata]
MAINVTTREQILAMEISSRELPLKAAECSLYAVLIIVAFFGNFMVFSAILRNSKLRTVPNYYIASLSIADMLMSLIMPLTLVTLIADDWLLGEVLCQCQGYAGSVLGVASLLTITLTAVNRYVRMVRVVDYPKYFSSKNALRSIVAAWIVAIITPIPYLATGHRFAFLPGKAFCFYDVDSLNIYYAVTTIVGFSVLPFGVTVLCYYKVFRTVRLHNSTWTKLLTRMSAPGARKFGVDEVKLAKLLFVILLSFAACWMPFVVIDTVGAFKGQFYFPRYVYLIYTASVGLSSCVNPVIYGAMNQEFRSEFKRILTISCCKISLPKKNAKAKYVVDIKADRGLQV